MALTIYPGSQVQRFLSSTTDSIDNPNTNSRLDILNNRFHSEIFDASGRLRVSNPFSQASISFVAGKNIQMHEEITGGGSVFPNVTGSVIQVGTFTGSTDSTLYQSSLYYPYYQGRGVFWKVAAAFGGVVTNSVIELGLLDDLNGTGFVQLDTGMNILVRSDTSGLPVDTLVPQASWDDPLDGTGVSGLTISVTNGGIFWCKYLWQGYGDVTFGVLYNDRLIPIHTVKHSFNSSTPFMRNPNLPFRIKTYNIGTSVGNSVLVNSFDLESEGTNRDTGELVCISQKSVSVTITASLVPIFAVRLKSSVGSTGLVNRGIAVLQGIEAHVINKTIYYEIQKVQLPTGAPTVGWTDESLLLESISSPSITGTNKHTISCGYLDGVKGGATAAIPDIPRNHLTHLGSSNTTSPYESEVIVIYAQEMLSGGAPATVSFSLELLESF